MKKGKYLNQCVAALAFISCILVIAAKADVTKNTFEDNANEIKRADIIIINNLKSFGELDRKEVPFLHDLHTDSLKKANKDCETCHLSSDSFNAVTLSSKFKRFEDKDRQETMDIYHTYCISCHKEMSAEGIRSGPTELCGQCHKGQISEPTDRESIVFDKYIHFTHTEAIKNNETNETDCGACHHEYDKEAGKLVYNKDDVGSCRYCHMPENETEMTSIKKAFHLSCIACHRIKSATNKKSGPIDCRGCHEKGINRALKKPVNIPRMKINQPDFTLIGSKLQKKDTKASGRMNPVPFNHKAHEKYQDTCVVCHHEAIESCSKTCHTISGSAKGNMISAEQAMHQSGSEQSCIGCHEIIKEQKKCAGCHILIGKESSMKENTCRKCHMELPEALSEKALTPEAMAATLFETRDIVSETFNDKDIPEIVSINKLSSQFGAVELPHKQIISALINDIEDSKLAGYFHSEKGTICQACHHNSPVSKNPPKCASCHNRTSTGHDLFRPDLKVAYHQQCMRCHDRMEIEKPESTSCADCHREIGVNKLYDF